MTHKYEPLEFHLRAEPATRREVTLSFTDVERILGAPLPASALAHREWWSNQSNTSNRPQAHAWTSAGFAVDVVHQERANAWVRFIRCKQDRS